MIHRWTKYRQTVTRIPVGWSLKHVKVRTAYNLVSLSRASRHDRAHRTIVGEGLG